MFQFSLFVVRVHYCLIFNLAFLKTATYFPPGSGLTRDLSAPGTELAASHVELHGVSIGPGLKFVNILGLKLCVWHISYSSLLSTTHRFPEGALSQCTNQLPSQPPSWALMLSDTSPQKTNSLSEVTAAGGASDPYLNYFFLLTSSRCIPMDHLACALKKRYVRASVTFEVEFKFHLDLDISNCRPELVSVVILIAQSDRLL